MAIEPNTSLEYVATEIPHELQGFKKALFIGDVEKINSVGVSQRLVVLTYDRIVCTKKEFDAVLSRYQKTENISRAIWQNTHHKKMPAVRILLKIPKERDLLILFHWDARNTEHTQPAMKFLKIIDTVRKAQVAAGRPGTWSGLSENQGLELKSRANLRGPLTKPSALLTEYTSPTRKRNSSNSVRSPTAITKELPKSPRQSTFGQNNGFPPVEDAESQQLFNELSADSVAKPRSLDANVEDITDINVMKQRFRDQADWCSKIEKHFVHIRAMNSYMTEQMRTKTEEVDRLTSRLSSLEKQQVGSPQTPGMATSIRKVSFIGLTDSNGREELVSSLEQQLHDAKAQLAEDKQLQDEVAMLSSTVNNLHKKKEDDEMRISELRKLINGLLQDKGEIAQENLQLQMSIEKNKSSQSPKKETTDTATDCQAITTDQPAVTEFTAKLLTIGMDLSEVNRLSMLSIRRREHLAYVNLSELTGEPCSLPVPVVRRLLHVFNFEPGETDKNRLVDCSKRGTSVTASLRDLNNLTSSIIKGSYVHSDTSLSSPGSLRSPHRVEDRIQEGGTLTMEIPTTYPFSSEQTLPIPNANLEHRPSVDVSFFSGLSSGTDTPRSDFNKTQTLKPTQLPSSLLIRNIGIDVAGARKAFSEESSNTSFGSTSTSTVSTA